MNFHHPFFPRDNTHLKGMMSQRTRRDLEARGIKLAAAKGGPYGMLARGTTSIEGDYRQTNAYEPGSSQLIKEKIKPGTNLLKPLKDTDVVNPVSSYGSNLLG